MHDPRGPRMPPRPGGEGREPFALVAGRYKPLSELGSGGACRVDLARDNATGRQVALKRLHERLIRDPTALLLLEAEAGALSILGGIGAPRLFGHSISGPDPYVAMEYVRGESLTKRRHGRSEAVRLLMNICAALSAAHGAGIVHRDVKIANIMILPSLVPKLIDFNYALVPGVEDAARRLPRPVGTPAFMAPEQTYPGAAVDRRADVYSLGIVAFCTLSGHYPYIHPDNADAEALYRLHRTARAPLMHELNPQVPPRLSLAVARAIEKFPERRYSGAGEFADALADCTGGAL